MSNSDTNVTNEGELLSPIDSSNEGGSSPSSRLMSQEGVYQLTKDLRSFSEALTDLKAVFLDDKNNLEQGLRVAAHLRLGDLLQVLKMVVHKYSELNSSDILTVAGELIQHVKSFNYEEDNADLLPEIFRAINNLAMVFSNSVSECLMGDANISTNAAISPPFDVSTPNAVDSSENQSTTSETFTQKSPSVADQTDSLLHQRESGLETAFERTKILSKYLGELINYVKKKSHIELEHAKSLLKLSQQTKTILSEQSFLPFQSLYCTSLDHDREFASNCQTTYQNLILQQKFVEALQAKKNEHDKVRKQIRDLWLKDKKRLDEAVSTMRKAKQNYQTKVHEHQKAREAAIKAEEDQQNQQAGQGAPLKLSSSGAGSTFSSVLHSSSGSGKVDKKKKQEEDSSQKAANAEVAYKVSVTEANKRSKELHKNKAFYLQQLRELIANCDQTAKSVTISYFQLHHQLYAPLPIQYQAMSEDAKRYEVGFQYTDYVRNLPTKASVGRTSYEFESLSADGSTYRVGGFSDTESNSSRSFDDQSPSMSPANLLRQTRRHSTGGSISSEDLLEDKSKEEKSTLALPPHLTGDIGNESSPVPLRALTRKGLKMAANAFKTKKLPKSNLFGVDFATAVQGSPDGIPFLIKRCISEIDNRALDTKGIYRVNGVKNRVEKLCNQFDTTPDRVDLSLQSPHDVSGVLKFFLRQLPDPLLQFQFYETFLEIAKEYQQLINSTNEAIREAQANQLPSPPPPSEEEMNSHVNRIRSTIEKLPFENRNTLQYVISHLTRVVSHSRDNKMTASNLAIVFGPTLLRPVTTDGNESLKMLIDLPFQSRIIEMLIVHKDYVFNTHSHHAGNIFPFSGFAQPQPSFTSDDKVSLTSDTSLSKSASKLSLDSDTPSQVNKEGSISLDRDILLSFEDDHVSTSTEHSATDSQYNTVTNTQMGMVLGDRAVFPNSSGMNEPVQQSLDPQYLDEFFSVFETTEAKPVSEKRTEFVRAASSSSLPREFPSQTDEIVTPPVPSRRTKKTLKIISDNGSLRAARMLHRGSLNLLRIRLPSKNTPAPPSPSPISPEPERGLSTGTRQMNIDPNKKYAWEGLQNSPVTTGPPASTPTDQENDGMGMLIDLTDFGDSNLSDPVKTSFC